jgi:hypothetical protein
VNEVMDEMAEACALLRQIGIAVEPDASPKNWVRHLCTALRTHISTKRKKREQKPKPDPLVHMSLAGYGGPDGGGSDVTSGDLDPEVMHSLTGGAWQPPAGGLFDDIV